MSVTFRNGGALAMRPGLRGDWASAIAAFRSTNYVNEPGVAARADRIDEIEAALASAGQAGATEPYKWLGSQLHVVAGAAP